MEANIDDVCVVTNTEEGHLILLREFFEVCEKKHSRLKLERCEFMQETLQYLGLDIGSGSLRSKPVIYARVQHEHPRKGLHDVCTSIGACSFYRLHMKKFTYSRPIQT